MVAVLVVLAASAFLAGGGWYEQTALDSAWPKKPAIARPAKGVAIRKLFWVPANIAEQILGALFCRRWFSRENLDETFVHELVDAIVRVNANCR